MRSLWPQPPQQRSQPIRLMSSRLAANRYTCYRENPAHQWHCANTSTGASGGHCRELPTRRGLDRLAVWRGCWPAVPAVLFIDNPTGHQGVGQRNALALGMGQLRVDGSRACVFFPRPVEEADCLWAATTSIGCVADAVEARLPRRHGIVNSVLGRHPAPDLMAFNNLRQRRELVFVPVLGPSGRTGITMKRCF
jgi:hypothetical protein